ncbi:MAG: response regulator, partial [Xanthomonadaceae bacterium]|nr:response regulator [Xanthomonadaceae bacterium]
MARILIVDDSPSQLVGLKRMVEKLGHQVVTAEDGSAGVEAARREKPDLILMDVVMP